MLIGAINMVCRGSVCSNFNEFWNERIGLITFNKERNVWDFTEATTDEKEALSIMAEQVWADMIAHQIAETWFQQDLQAKREKEKQLETKNPAEIIQFPGNKPH